MVKRKLARLKRAEERKIIKEHEGLYKDLVKENYPAADFTARAVSEADSPVTKTFRPARKWPFVLTGAVSAVVFVFAAVAVFNRLFTYGLPFSRNSADREPNYNITANDEGYPGNIIKEDGIGGVVLPTDGLMSVNISAVKNALTNSLLVTDGLNFKSVTEKKTDGETEYYRIEVDTVTEFHVFDIIVAVSESFRLEDELLPWESPETDDSGEFTITYSAVRRQRGDYYAFITKAKVDTGKEIYYITYNYTSVDPECELIDLIYYYIKPAT